MFNDILILIILLLASGFFSGSEIAFVVANKIKIEIKARRENFSAKSVMYFMSKPQNFFSTILIGNNVTNIAYASIATIFLSTFFGLEEYSILLITTFSLLIFGELLPKYFSRELAERVILTFALPLRILTFLIYPFVKLTSSIAEILTKSANVNEENISNLFQKEDIQTLVSESHEAGIVNKKEIDIINRVLELGEQKVYEAMRPRTEIIGVETESSVEDVINVFIESGFSKLPVYEENLDNIKGVVFAYDMFKLPNSINEIIREVNFVPETKKSIEMLNEFLSSRNSIAIVVDEFGGTAGIVTIEDLIEELFGEIKDEYDIEDDLCRKIADNIYLISGKVEIDFINEQYNINLPYGEYETIAGLITSSTGKIPMQGETVVINNLTFLIIRASTKKIEMVKLIINEDNR